MIITSEAYRSKLRHNYSYLGIFVRHKNMKKDIMCKLEKLTENTKCVKLNSESSASRKVKYIKCLQVLHQGAVFFKSATLL